MDSRCLIAALILFNVFSVVSSVPVAFMDLEQSSADGGYDKDNTGDYYIVLPMKRQYSGRPVWAKYAWMRTNGKRSSSSQGGVQRSPPRINILRLTSLLNV